MERQTEKLEAFFTRMGSDNKELGSLIDQFKNAVLLFTGLPPLKNQPAIPPLDQSLFNQGKAAFAVEDWPLDELELPEALNFIIPKLAALLPDQTENLENFKKTIIAEPSLMATLTRWLLKRDENALIDFAEQNNIDINTLLYTTQNIFQGRASEMADIICSATGLNIADWKHGYCPVCGSPAGFSYLAGEGGSRHLTCTVCRAHWRYTRNACPYCEVDKPDNIMLFYVEEKSGQKVEACSSCKRYILSADLRKKPEDMAFAHFLPYSMIPLDILMNEKDFTPGAGA